MDGRGGCCIARYSGGGGGGGGEMSYGISKVDKIMLRFRPIAPKPMSAGSGSSCSTMDNSDGYGGTRRRKRKYVRVNGNKTKKATTTTVSKKQKATTKTTRVLSGDGDAVVTLSLIPETPDRKEKSPATSSPSENHNESAPVLLSFDNQKQTVYDGHVRVAGGHVVSDTDHAVMMTSTSPPPPQKPQVISYVIVECVTDTWVNGGCLGFADMEMDTCPSFITDIQDTVVWTNKAYREMTAGGCSDEMAVVVVKKYNRVTMPVAHAAFTCKVKVTWGNEKVTSPSTLTAPCDVWRLRSGGYAWRLDVKAALSLGL